MTEPLRIGLAGLGTVGTGAVRMIQRHPELIAARAGRPVAITAISARSRRRDRGVDLSAYAWVDQATELATRYGLGQFIHHYPHALSGGMRQRVALMRTLAMDRDLMLLDEPFAGIDPISIADIRDLAQQHLDAGADHVPVQVLTSPEKLVPALTELAGPLGLR